MATYYGYGMATNGVTSEDILQASSAISSSKLESQGTVSYGSGRNEWQKPITEYGSNDPQWEVNLKASPYVGDIDFGRREWARSRKAVDEVLDLLLKEMRERATKYQGLRVDSYIRQGSSRDGLKVISPNEFDTVIEFHFDGLSIQHRHITEKAILKNGRTVPGYCYLQVNKTEEQLKTNFPKLFNEAVFKKVDGLMFLSSKKLFRGVFLSLVDEACSNIQKKIEHLRNTRLEPVRFSLTRRINPPAINVTIRLKEDNFDIDIDIVPGIHLKDDNSTMYCGRVMNAPIHAVCKWKEEEASTALEFVDQDIVWHTNSAGYEKFVLDVARENQRERYIITALRIIKTYFSKTRKASSVPPQIATVLKSYHLKQIAFYLIMYLCHFHKSVRINGVGDVIGYFYDFLRASISSRHLPHFFYSNSKIGSMFPNFPRQLGALRFDLFRRIPTESLNQAELSLKNHLFRDLGLHESFGDYGEFNTALASFTSEISGGDSEFF